MSADALNALWRLEAIDQAAHELGAELRRRDRSEQLVGLYAGALLRRLHEYYDAAVSGDDHTATVQSAAAALKALAQRGVGVRRRRTYT